MGIVLGTPSHDSLMQHISRSEKLNQIKKVNLWHHFRNILPLKSLILGVNGSLNLVYILLYFCYHNICHNVKWWWNGYGLGFCLSRWDFKFHFEHFTIMTYMIKNNHGDMVRNNNNNIHRHESLIWWFVGDLLIILHPFFLGWQIACDK
jgi:hypothetical protein